MDDARMSGEGQLEASDIGIAKGTLGEGTDSVAGDRKSRVCATLILVLHVDGFVLQATLKPRSR